MRAEPAAGAGRSVRGAAGRPDARKEQGPRSEWNRHHRPDRPWRQSKPAGAPESRDATATRSPPPGHCRHHCHRHRHHQCHHHRHQVTVTTTVTITANRRHRRLREAGLQAVAERGRSSVLLLWLRWPEAEQGHRAGGRRGDPRARAWAAGVVVVRGLQTPRRLTRAQGRAQGERTGRSSTRARPPGEAAGPPGGVTHASGAVLRLEMPPSWRGAGDCRPRAGLDWSPGVQRGNRGEAAEGGVRSRPARAALGHAHRAAGPQGTPR